MHDGDDAGSDAACPSFQVHVEERQIQVEVHVREAPRELDVGEREMRLRLGRRCFVCALPEQVLPTAPLNRVVYNRRTGKLLVTLRRPFASSTWQLFADFEERFAQMQQQAKRVFGSEVDEAVITGDAEEGALMNVDVRVEAGKGVFIDLGKEGDGSCSTDCCSHEGAPRRQKPLVLLGEPGQERTYLPWAESAEACSSTEDEAPGPLPPAAVAARVARQAKRAGLRVGPPAVGRADGRPVKGFSVFTTRARREGDVVTHYRGSLLRRADMRRTPRAQRFYFALDDEWAMDGGTGGSKPRAAHVAAYLNSPAGCIDPGTGQAMQPNLKPKIDPSKGLGQRSLKLVALRDIEDGEELLFDYGDCHNLEEVSSDSSEDEIWKLLEQASTRETSHIARANKKKKKKKQKKKPLKPQKPNPSR
eukprot:TRINITY_DN77444_c0_g1_i1.p1 TRINITY_DN77444_c0_g1~~TRINITY_DN77444_c0_g1_i1.p1  ORF type:complete len:419 (-),score=85.26 TRINITY_DN77444_c0_g1_i1:25-1281(-)